MRLSLTVHGIQMNASVSPGLRRGNYNDSGTIYTGIKEKMLRMWRTASRRRNAMARKERRKEASMQELFW